MRPVRRARASGDLRSILRAVCRVYKRAGRDRVVAEAAGRVLVGCVTVTGINTPHTGKQREAGKRSPMALMTAHLVTLLLRVT
ncbi:hypothetical protein E2C01_018125 [Portunus trituberculatus]|uniref:Uncharacterized protein n=1 Tax=Portunus trituberculatus TaxID=210409 RepID=A0A5B7DVL0_PORTR|nr:hypothetical protein [Portunus trituberculatus]